MKKCIFCKNEFEKLAEEHIIPNVACGRFKSKNLISIFYMEMEEMEKQLL